MYVRSVYDENEPALDVVPAAPRPVTTTTAPTPSLSTTLATAAATLLRPVGSTPPVATLPVEAPAPSVARSALDVVGYAAGSKSAPIAPVAAVGRAIAQLDAPPTAYLTDAPPPDSTAPARPPAARPAPPPPSMTTDTVQAPKPKAPWLLAGGALLAVLFLVKLLRR